jgi:putative glutamine amidotransferase
MDRPLIGITTYRQPATWGRWHEVDATLLPAAYIEAVRAGGGTPMLIPPLGPADSAAAVVSRHGLLISGGSDVNPSRYGAEPHPATSGWRDDRDVSEMALVHAADDIGLPLLGICRGMQIMAVAAGGTLIQHVPDVVGEDAHSPGADVYGAVEVTTEPGTRLARILGGRVAVACHHHQAVADHPGFLGAARAEDGLLEAMEAPGDRFRLAVQWHPETQSDRRLFEALAGAASDWATRRPAQGPAASVLPTR